MYEVTSNKEKREESRGYQLADGVRENRRNNGSRTVPHKDGDVEEKENCFPRETRALIFMTSTDVNNEKHPEKYSYFENCLKLLTVTP